MDDEKLSAETLSGDIRDMILTHIRAMETPWSKLNERQQADKIYAATEAGKSAIRGAIKVIVSKGFPMITVATGKFTVKDGVKLEVAAAQNVEVITALAEHGTGSAVLILVEASTYFGQRNEALPDKDQPDLPIDTAEWPGWPDEQDPPHDPETGEIAPTSDDIDGPLGEATDPPADGINTATVTHGGKRKRVTVDELQAELKAGKVRVHGIGDVEVV